MFGFENIWAFAKAGRDVEYPQTCAVNYVCMDQYRDDPQPIPTYFFCRVQQNAARYPHVQFHVWGENSHIAQDYVRPANVVIRDLNSLPAFSCVPVLSDSNPNKIWTKVDIARLLVVRHVLGEPNVGLSIYSDFDVKDVSVRSRAFKKRLRNYGCAFGATFDQRFMLRFQVQGFENGYMAFTRASIGLLDHIIDNIKSVNDGGRSRIYHEMKDLIDQWADTKDENFPREWRKKVASFKVLYPCTWRKDLHLRAQTVTKAG